MLRLASFQGCVKIWDIGNPKHSLHELSCLSREHYIRSCKLLPQNNHLIVGGEDAKISVWDLSASVSPHPIPSHPIPSPLHCLIYHTYPPLLVVAASFICCVLLNIIESLQLEKVSIVKRKREASSIVQSIFQLKYSKAIMIYCCCCFCCCCCCYSLLFSCLLFCSVVSNLI